MGGSNITQFIISTEKFISLDDKRYDQLKVEKGWIIITRSGTTGIVSSVPSEWDGFGISEHVIRIVPDSEKIDPDYLLSILKSSYAKKHFTRGIFGSVIDEITPEHICDLDIPLPKDKKVYKSISKSMREAEIQRNDSIKKHNQSIEKI